MRKIVTAQFLDGKHPVPLLYTVGFDGNLTRYPALWDSDKHRQILILLDKASLFLKPLIRISSV